MPFTDRQIAALKPKPARYEKMEPGRTGLGMRVTPSGGKTWAYRYRFDGEQRRMVFGTYPKMGVAKAHVALADARQKLRAGIDPGAVVAEERKAERTAETMADLVAEYVLRHAKVNMKPSTAVEDERLLTREIIPHLGRRKAKDVSRRELIVVLDGIEDRGAPVVRNRVAGVLSRLFRFGLDRGIIDASPAAGIRRLDEGKGRERFLSMEEIRSLWHGLDEISATLAVRDAIKFTLITGQRRGEVAGAARSEIDDAEGLWRLPGERAKNGRENLIPLPPFIMALVKEIDRHRVTALPAGSTLSPYLFPARMIAAKPVEPNALTAVLNRNRGKLGIGDATIHDLRRSFATWNSETGVAPEILSALLNHTPKTLTGRVYDRAENIEPRRRAMERWCDWLQFVIAGEFEAARKMQGAVVLPLTDAA